jgi:8-oxo-dGTP diphosphatase
VTTIAADGRMRIGSYAVCFDGAGRVLLCRLSPGVPGAGLWNLPGGGLDFGEHPDAGLKRELEEETGLEGRIDGLLTIYSNVIPAEQMTAAALHTIGIVYRVSIVGSAEPRGEVDGSSDACGWFALAEALELPLTWIARESLGKASVVEGQ